MKGKRPALEYVSVWTAEVREKAELWTHTHTQDPFLAAHTITCAVLKCSPLIIVAQLMYKHTQTHTWLHKELCRCVKWDRGLIHRDIISRATFPVEYVEQLPRTVVHFLTPAVMSSAANN